MWRDFVECVIVVHSTFVGLQPEIDRPNALEDSFFGFVVVFEWVEADQMQRIALAQSK